MTNKDLKRFYAGQGSDPKDFVRLNSSGKIPDDNIPSNVAKLNAQGKIPADNLPSYVDDVIDGYYYNSKFWEDSAHTKQITGEAGKIYLDVSTNKAYRYATAIYVLIGDSFKLYRHQLKFRMVDSLEMGWDDLLFTFYWESSSQTALTASTIGVVFDSFANTSDAGVCTVKIDGLVLTGVYPFGVARLALGNDNDTYIYVSYWDDMDSIVKTKSFSSSFDGSGFKEFTDTVTQI